MEKQVKLLVTCLPDSGAASNGLNWIVLVRGRPLVNAPPAEAGVRTAKNKHLKPLDQSIDMKDDVKLHRLILVYGPGSGFGKSTLAAQLCAQLQARGLPVRLILEDEVLSIPEFSKYVRQVEYGYAGDSETLLDCCRAFVEKLEGAQPEIIILDSILPCWDWLFTAKCTSDHVGHFSQKLCAFMHNLCPVLIYVEGDIEAALSRAVADRGEVWALNLAKKRTGNRRIGDLVEYFTDLRRAADAMIESWCYDTIRVNTIESSVELVANSILDMIRLPQDNIQHNEAVQKDESNGAEFPQSAFGIF